MIFYRSIQVTFVKSNYSVISCTNEKKVYSHMKCPLQSDERTDVRTTDTNMDEQGLNIMLYPTNDIEFKTMT